MSDPIAIIRLNGLATSRRKTELSRLLIDAVESDASVGFLSPLSTDEADAFWAGVKTGVANGSILLFGADMNGQLVGTVQLHLVRKPNQPHRAEVAKLLVLRACRRRGIAKALMRAVEAAAIEAKRTLLVLDTTTKSTADTLYRSLGWTETGIIPDYAMYPDGRFCDVTFFHKRLG